jgi:hypothetical protein
VNQRVDDPAAAAGARLIIGVTAHRDLLASLVPEIERDVSAFIERLRDAHPGLPLMVMSGLAEGGDRLVARCALALGIPVSVPLPLPLDDYVADFAAAESRAELAALLARSQVFELPLASGNDAESVRRPGAARDRQYAQMGVYISSHCQVLLALWDGRRPEAVGGTADVVHFHLHGEMPGLLDVEEAPPNLFADDDSDLVYHIACPRAREPGEVAQPLAAQWLTRSTDSPGSGPMPPAYQRLFGHLQAFNADARKYAEPIARDGRSLLPREGEVACPPAAQAIDRLYMRADWLALHFRQRVHNSLLFLHVLAVLTGLMFMLYSDFDTARINLVALLALFSAGLLVARIGARRGWHRRYLDYRVLAEGLRVQYYWTIAGVPTAHRVRFAYDSFMQKQDVELGWIRHVMRGASLGQRGATDNDSGGLRWVVANWVGDGGSTGQLGYFRRRAGERERKYRHTEALGRISLATSLGCAVVLLLLHDQLPAGIGRVLLVLMGVAALFAGVREAYSHKLADKELIKQYRFMARIFAAAAQRLAQNNDAVQQRRVLEALGEAALEEHAEWILMHRERPLEHNRLG